MYIIILSLLHISLHYILKQENIAQIINSKFHRLERNDFNESFITLNHPFSLSIKHPPIKICKMVKERKDHIVLNVGKSPD